MKVAIFTSAHLADDIRIYHKQILSLLNAGYEIYYYTNRADASMSHSANAKRSIKSNNKLHVFFNQDYNEERRLARFLRSLFILKILNKNCSVFHFHDPDLIVTGLLLKLMGKKVIYDVHEDYQASILSKTYLPQFMRKTLSFGYRHLEKIAAKFFDAIVCATPAISARFTNCTNKDVITINNYPLLSEIFVDHYNTNRQNQFIYSGGITPPRGVHNIISALKMVNKDIPCRLKLIGQIHPESYEKFLKNLDGWEYVDYLGYLDRPAMFENFSKVKFGIITFLPFPNHIDAQPNKLFEYMSAGLPIISSNFPLWSAIVDGEKIGVCVDPEDPINIAAGIQNLLRTDTDKLMEMGGRARSLVLAKYNWDVEASKLIELYRKFEK